MAIATTGWLASLQDARSLEDLRQGLLDRHPAFAPGELTRLAVIGASEEGRRLVGLCEDLGIAVVAIVDDSPERIGQKVGPCTVAPFDALSDLDKATPVVIASHRLLGARERLQALGMANVAPFALLQVLAPDRFRPHVFYDGWLEELLANRERYGSLPGQLVDDFSRQVLEAVLGFRMTLDPRILAPIVEWDLYAPANLLRYSEDEVYVDGGSFDGDTIRLFIGRVHGRFSRVLAFEPDQRTFSRLAANFAHEPRVEPIQKGLHRRRSTLRFDHAGTRGSTLVAAGEGTEIPVVGLDEILDGARVTFIKMNIEGAEPEALLGASVSIRRWRPKLAISVYHRPSHLWEIRSLIEEIHPAYDFYLRQHDGGVIETVLYAIPQA